MLFFNIDKEKCTGCGACFSICPKNCITMQEDPEGFLYPQASDSCVNCGLCKSVCPSINIKEKVDNKKQFAFGYRTGNYEEWKKSSSGGAFVSLVKVFADSNTKIFGAAWDGFKVHHIYVNLESIERLQKSKYISSAIEDSYKQTLGFLKKGEKVVFSGCPCQVAGLKSYLRKEYDNLLTIDLICHGQGSNKVFLECLRDTENLIGNKILKYEFRSKRRYFETEYMSKVETENSSFYLKSERYTQLFLNQLCIRPSCGYNCIFHSKERVSDFTIADLKGLENIKPNLLGCKFNYSTIIANSEKGLKLVDSLCNSSFLFPLKIEDVCKYNPNFYMRGIYNIERRDAFFADFINNKGDAISKYTTSSTLSIRTPFWSIYDFLPHTLRRLIILTYRRFKNR